MRLFIGVFPPTEITTHLDARIRSFPALHQLRWIPSASLHLTLKFIGQATDENASSFQSVLGKVASRYKSFKLWFEGGGVFPHRRNPRVFWTGIGGEVDPLKRLTQQLEEEFGFLGFPPENRRFSPHLTLARTQGNEPPIDEFINMFASYKSPPFELGSIHLIQSQLTAERAEYKILSSHELGVQELEKSK